MHVYNGWLFTGAADGTVLQLNVKTLDQKGTVCCLEKDCLQCLHGVTQGEKDRLLVGSRRLNVVDMTTQELVMTMSLGGEVKALAESRRQGVLYAAVTSLGQSSIVVLTLEKDGGIVHSGVQPITGGVTVSSLAVCDTEGALCVATCSRLDLYSTVGEHADTQGGNGAHLVLKSVVRDVVLSSLLVADDSLWAVRNVNRGGGGGGCLWTCRLEKPNGTARNLKLQNSLVTIGRLDDVHLLTFRWHDGLVGIYNIQDDIVKVWFYGMSTAIKSIAVLPDTYVVFCGGKHGHVQMQSLAAPDAAPDPSGHPSRGLSPWVWQCGWDRCPRAFLTHTDLRRHVVAHHSSRRAGQSGPRQAGDTLTCLWTGCRSFSAPVARGHNTMLVGHLEGHVESVQPKKLS